MEQSWQLVVRTEISKQEDFNRISLCIDHINTVWPCRKARRCDSYLQIACKNADYLRRKGILWICFYGTIFAKKSNRKSNPIFPILSDFQTFPNFQTFRLNNSSPVQSNKFPCEFFTLLRGGTNPIWKLSENSWNLFCPVVSLRHQCRANRSRSTIQYLWEILKSLISQNIRSTFCAFSILSNLFN